MNWSSKQTWCDTNPQTHADIAKPHAMINDVKPCSNIGLPTDASFCPIIPLLLHTYSSCRHDEQQSSHHGGKTSSQPLQQRQLLHTATKHKRRKQPVRLPQPLHTPTSHLHNCTAALPGPQAQTVLLAMSQAPRTRPPILALQRLPGACPTRCHRHPYKCNINE
jgi:hypothetical protein